MNYPNFLVLSGWGFSHEILRPFVNALESRCINVQVNLNNNLNNNLKINLLEIKKNYYSDTLKSTAENFFKYIEKSKNNEIIIIGWSLGGLLARALAYYYPDIIKGCITLCSSPCFIRQDDFPGVDPKFFSGFHHNLTNAGIDQLKKEFLFLCAMGSPSPKQWLKAISPFFLSSPEFFSLNQSGLNILATDFRHEAKKINIPSLHIYGEHDRLVPLCDLPTHQSPSIRLIKKAGHLLPLTHTDACLELIVEYLELND